MSHSDSLCLDCGLCCDGTLFARVDLVASDRRGPFRARGLCSGPGGEEYLQQPCAAFTGSRCNHYADRPQACRDYRCKLLLALEQGSTTAAEAAATVAQAKGLAATVRRQLESAMPALAHQPLHDVIGRHWAALSEAERRAVPPALQLEIGALLVMLERFFQTPSANRPESPKT